MEHTTFDIYALIDPRDGEIRYIGQTVQPLRNRVWQHLANWRVETDHKARWLAQLDRQGCCPQITLVQTLPMSAWSDAEVYWISFFRSLGCQLVNMSPGGDGCPGRVNSPEHNAKIGAARRGHKKSPETLKLMSEAAKRQMANPAARAAVSAVHTGKVISEAHREAIRVANRERWARLRSEGWSFPAEARAKLAVANTNPSEATRAKMREGHRRHRAKGGVNP